MGLSVQEAPVSRGEQKQRTRAKLLHSALSLMAAGKPFGALSLREITAHAGVVPATFYRHFSALDELAFALVEESGMTLRRLLRDVRKTGLPPTSMLLASVKIYRQYVEDHRAHFLFVCSERNGGSPPIRAAVKREEQHFSAELALDLRQMGWMPGLSSGTLQMACYLVVSTMMNAASDILDLPEKNPQLEREFVERFVRQLRLIFLGAKAWRDA
jgi:TetR/AcrR family transcriptional regulator, fatty acid biosynthesis regulator